MYTSADVQAALADASRFAAEGLYEQALERHVWYHENALKYSPAQFGVRLSFALSAWADLGEAYPEAMEALRIARDNALSTYRRDPTDALMFMEVLSVDFALDDLTAAKDLFYEGLDHGMDRFMFSLYLDRILATGDTQWARDVIGNPRCAARGDKGTIGHHKIRTGTREELQIL